MAIVKPFKGYRYDISKIGDMGDVVSPPYYNIKPHEKAEMYEKSEYNSVRLFSGEELPTDTDTDNKFTRSANYLNEWIEKGILKRDEEPAIYLYEEAMVVNGVHYINRSFVTLVQLEELGNGKIMSCEEIREVSMQDRYDFLISTNADMSMITCLYMEREKYLLNLMNELSDNAPDMEFDSYDDIHHRLWIITDKEVIEYIQKQFENLPLYITEGQTRYETCLQYQSYKKSQNPNHDGTEPYNYTMVSLINANSDGIAIRPVHRGVVCPHGFKRDFFVSCVQDHFRVEKIIVDKTEESLVKTMKKQIATTRKETRIAVYCGGDYFYRLYLTDKDFIHNELLPDHSEDYCSLDIVVLNKLLLEDILRVTPEKYEERVEMSRSATKLYDEVNNGDFGVMFVMNPVKNDQIRNVTAAGETLPVQSVSIYPKPSVGVIINIKEN